MLLMVLALVMSGVKMFGKWGIMKQIHFLLIQMTYDKILQ